MTVSEKIRLLCARQGITMKELAARLGMSPQNCSGKLRRGSFSIGELEAIGKAAGCPFRAEFLLPDGTIL